MSAFDDLLNEARDAGVQEDWIDRIKAASDGSPIRAENRTLKEQNASLAEQVGKYRTGTLGQQLKALGFQGDPAALNPPADLDPFDTAKVTEWAVPALGLQPPQPTEQEQQRANELAGHDRIANATTGTSPQPLDDQKRAEVLAAKTPEEFARLAELNGFTQQR